MTNLVSLSNPSLGVGSSTLGPWATPAGAGLQLRVDRASLPAGALASMKPYFSFDNQATWVKQFEMWLVGGVQLEKDGSTPRPYTVVSSEWQNTPALVPIVPTHIKVDLVVTQAFTPANVWVDTL